MKRYLVEQGAPADAVVEDLTADYMQQHGLRSVIAVSQYYHISRTKLARERSGAIELPFPRALPRPRRMCSKHLDTGGPTLDKADPCDWSH